MHKGHFWHLEETGCRKYSLFAKVGRSWKGVSPITCRNRKESELFFFKTLSRASGFKVKVQVRPIQKGSQTMMCEKCRKICTEEKIRDLEAQVQKDREKLDMLVALQKQLDSLGNALGLKQVTRPGAVVGRSEVTISAPILSIWRT